MPDVLTDTVAFRRAQLMLSQQTALSFDQAGKVLSDILKATAPAAGLRPDLLDELTSKPTSLDLSVFMENHALADSDIREALREFRSETCGNPFEYGERDVLSAEFLNWYEWERLG